METKASQGYELDTTVHEVTITKAPAAQVKTVTYSDVPALDPGAIELHKVPFVNNTIRDDVDGVPVENAYFLLEYFDNHTFTGPATRQWKLCHKKGRQGNHKTARRLHICLLLLVARV